MPTNRFILPRDSLWGGYSVPAFRTAPGTSSSRHKCSSAQDIQFSDQRIHFGGVAHVTKQDPHFFDHGGVESAMQRGGAWQLCKAGSTRLSCEQRGRGFMSLHIGLSMCCCRHLANAVACLLHAWEGGQIALDPRGAV